MEALKIGLVYGSKRDFRLCDAVARWATDQIERFGGFSVRVIDPKVLELDGHIAVRDDLSEDIRDLIADCDSFLVLTAEKNHGYAGTLKDLIDSADTEWHAKPVGFVSYGASTGGLRAVEQLRQVFAELHVVTIRDVVSFPNAWDTFDASGHVGETVRQQRAMVRLLDYVAWWASVLKAGRQTVPYDSLSPE